MKYAIPFAVGKTYVENYFDYRSKQKVWLFTITLNLRKMILYILNLILGTWYAQQDYQ